MGKKILLKNMLLLASSGLLICNILTANASQTQIGRYTTFQNKPTRAQINPLLAVGQFRFPPSVETVGDAIDVILQNTSYKLSPKKQLSNEVLETLLKPLPITVRNLGPIEIKDAVVILMGKDVFTLVVDPLHRLINFDVKPEIKKALLIRSKKYAGKQ